MMVLGYAIIAVPVGLLGAEVTARETRLSGGAQQPWALPHHGAAAGGGLLGDAKFCQYCGSRLAAEVRTPAGQGAGAPSACD
mmetsp:Transcript_3388/g.8972  ORF Transcript_3388/g.8972 Transcript_3388/m.8972 type:complete len:82 (-) Transcript_3388:31-276(-)